MKIIVLAVALALVLPAAGRADDIDEIYQAIQKGRWRAAADRLAEMKDVNSNGNLLFLHGLLERSGDRAAKFFETALTRSVSVKFQEEIYIRLAQYYLQMDNLGRVSEITNEYRTRFEKGKHRVAMARIRILAEEMNGDRTAALGLNERYMKANSRGESADWGKMDLARILLGSRGDETGVEKLRDLSASSSEIAVPQAMAILGEYHMEKGEIEEAMRCYELLREEYPSAIGLDLLARQLGQSARPKMTITTQSAKPKPLPKAEKYAIQAGAFSSQKFANEQVDRLRRERLPTKVEKKESDGRTLWVVYIGEYKDLRAAEEARQKLQKRYGETYEVVPR
ncbi:MAG: SPOR domain-containing protein [bacterium]|nr:SPOR domain-containing protein [bacterium]